MKIANSISELPSSPAIYGIYGGTGRSRHVAYVGLADNLRRRLGQHLIRRDSSITTGVSIVALNPDLVTDVDWWEHQAFRDGVALEAAETVAFEVLNPTLRSRSAVQRLARQYREEETDFESEMRELFAGPPTGRLTRPSLETAFVKIDALEKRIAELEHRLADLSFKTRRD